MTAGKGIGVFGDQSLAPDTPLSQIAVIDFEASGLGSASYPTEIGWAFVEDDGSITSGAVLIRPPAQWRIYDNAWSAAAERLTLISQEMLDREGVSPREALERFHNVVGDRELYSDNADFDRHWLGMLADAAGISVVSKIDDLTALINRFESTVQGQEAPRHRAEADARRLAGWLLLR